MWPFRTRTPRRPSPARRAAPRLRAESLEDRTTPAGGLLDPTFDGDGRRDLTANVIRNVLDTAVQPDGKIVAVGSVSTVSKGTTTSTLTVVRMNPNGSLDTTFSGDGIATVTMKNSSTAGGAIALQPDGRIVVGGRSAPVKGSGSHQYLVARLNPNGSLDTSFGTTGLWTYDTAPGGDGLSGLAVLADGSIVGGGTGRAADGWQGFAAVKLTPAGQLDPSFGAGGYTTVHVGADPNSRVRMAVTPAGGVVLSGSTTVPGDEDHGCLVALTPAGQLDSGFNGGAGFLIADLDGPDRKTYLRDVAVQGNSIVVAGFTTVEGDSQGLVARYTLAGQVDPTFGTNGVYVGEDHQTGYQRVEVAADGSVVVAGYTIQADGTRRGRVGHLSADGVLDTSFRPDGTGFATVAPPWIDYPSLSIAPNGSILLAGATANMGSATSEVTTFFRFTAP